MIVAIDGPAGAGKSTVAGKLSKRLGFVYIDTGAMYRAATLTAMRFAIPLDDGAAIADRFKTLDFHFKPSPDSARFQAAYFGDEDISAAIRTPELTKNIRTVCAQPEIRALMTELQRSMGRESDSVLEGRDIGTVVFPDADCKFYLDARVDIRARRRLNDLRAAGNTTVSFDELVEEIASRDAADMTRENAPLKRADDAEYVDTSDMSIDDVIAYLEKRIRTIRDNGAQCE